MNQVTALFGGTEVSLVGGLIRSLWTEAVWGKTLEVDYGDEVSGFAFIK